MSDKGKKQPRAGAPEGGSSRAQAPDSAKKVKADGKRAQATADTGYVEVRDPNYVPRFKKRYNDVVKPELMKEFGYKNAMQVPKINKIVLNIGAGEGGIGFQEDSAGADGPDGDRRPEAGRDHAPRSRSRPSRSRPACAIGAKVTLRKDRDVRIPGPPR